MLGRHPVVVLHGARQTGKTTLERRGRLLPIEVKATAHPRPADLRGLHVFQDTFPEEAPFGLVICGCRAPAALSRRILAVPFEAALLT